ncbi:MAG: hypothetical protein H8D34_30945 [Chloroflexi bacterium]|nr:hypothetical protein [Chloroflexota bacterium]
MSSKSYERKKRRRLEIKKTLPENLRDRIALRNVMAVARLSPAQQHALANALDIGLKRVPTALRCLETHQDAPAEELLRASLGNRGARHAGGSPAGRQAYGRKPRPSPPAPAHSGPTLHLHPEALDELLGLLKTCYPEMNPHSARALAESEALRDILAVLTVYEQVFDSPHFNTDFVVVLFYNLLAQTREQLDQRIGDNPAYQQALRQAGVDISVDQESVDQSQIAGPRFACP